MDISERKKQEIIQGLLVTKQRAHNLEIILRFAGNSEEADAVKETTSALTAQIDTLLSQLISEWLASSVDVVENIKNSNANLQRAINKISRGVDTAQNIVKAIGFIDEAVAIAAKLAAAAA